jgi:glycerol-3-phosphate acyltransferase PlsY
MRLLRLISAALLGYLAGTLPSADLASRIASGGQIDLRRAGSRNPGAMNARRVLGGTPGRAVMVVDVAKGYAACACGRAVAGDLGAHTGGTAAVIGHCYPMWSGFRGGKGVAASFGQCLYTFPVAAPLDLALAVGVARVPRLRHAGLVSTVVASTVWLGMSFVWWRKRLPNSWGPRPTAALFVANCATVAVIGSRFVAAYRRGDPDELAAGHQNRPKLSAPVCAPTAGATR